MRLQGFVCRLVVLALVFALVLSAYFSVCEKTLDQRLNLCSGSVEARLDALVPHPLYTIVVTKTQPHFTITVYTKNDIISQNLKKLGVWDGGLTEVASAILDARKDSGGAQTVVDFGTHVGYFSLLSASKGYTVIGIEPMGSNRHAICRSIALNGFDNLIELHAGALGDGSPSSPKELCIKSRVAGSNIGNGQTTDAGKDCMETVPVFTLSRIIGQRQVAFLKADCEGCEANAFMGMKEIIAGNSPPCSLSIEWRPDSMRKLGGDPFATARLLLSSGYMVFMQKCSLVTGEGLTLTEIPLPDVITFLNKSSKDLIMLHDSKECFARDEFHFQYVMNRVVLFRKAFRSKHYPANAAQKRPTGGDVKPI